MTHLLTEKAWSFQCSPTKSAPPMTSAALGFEIIGTGHYVPGQARHERAAFPRDGHVGRVDLPAFRDSPAPLRAGGGRRERSRRRGRQACHRGGAASTPGDIDYIVFATMTPDYVFPGSGALVGAKLGLEGVPALDIRQQCGAMLFGVQIVDGLIKSGAAKTILFVGAEAHAGFMPWDDWDVLDPARATAGHARGARAGKQAPGARGPLRRRRRARSSFARPTATRGCAASSSTPTGAAPSCSTCRAAASATRPYWKKRRLRRAGVHPQDGRQGALQVRRAPSCPIRRARSATEQKVASTRSTGSWLTRPTSASTSTSASSSAFPPRRCR